MTDAVGSIDMPDADDEAAESKKKSRKGGKRGKKGPLGRLALFYRQIVAELRKVVWPTRSQLSTYTTVVIVFVVIMIGLVTVIDYGFQEAVKYVFG
ncbi:preprotein translocase subunit SecE [Streptomyces sp. NPDC087908]|uniref:Protein translocase subunit SecE n=1 Tax=Streptomyces venezuelae (strain ATCC 10712 / CBS 650.69 / DSM 40230 / JCM 4526 / NBRC 13096 / PD 04745) TaxID=953739 RepID=F2RIR8_STRVP|nr:MULTISPECIES: preprotein translocase subunit SecE [Streptomyces]MYS07486.1 preprotein translocase subunit SecE [Streptomyces sp. SID6041]WSV40560.1 preprotein translocase subunit SecE [Streptomyces sp. NBC_01077]APE23318.1 preprotein translocase subunit SecE [Streptomyces venezuelae]MCX4982791.1 preprotein translocase subunit SecE [Streptomyces sp. NBC_00572]MCX5228019.1 preprotein translocase subunit SecE [Streptomyces sp. NBC_00233]